LKPISAVINARMDSSRVPNKMIRPFAGTSLIEIALRKLDKLHFFNYRFFAVAEDELIKLARKYPNIEILERKPEAVAKGPHPATVTFEHYLRIPTPHIFVINACAAFISIEIIQRAFEIFQDTDFRSYMSAIPTREWIFTKDGIPVTHKDPYALQNTSDGPVYYKAAHSFYIINKDYFKETNGILWTLTPNDPYLIEIPPDSAIDVDTEIQFHFASFLYERMIKEKI
jgi:CMP-N-acetylneuraminic acid synthetase